MPCPEGSTLIEPGGARGFRGMVDATYSNGRDEAEVTLKAVSLVWVGGYAREGHPEQGCIDGQPCPGYESQDKEEFKVSFDTEELGTYRDKGADRQAWIAFGMWQTTKSFAPGTYKIRVEHLYMGQWVGAQSVDYKLSFCAFPPPTSRR